MKYHLLIKTLLVQYTLSIHRLVGVTINQMFWKQK